MRLRTLSGLTLTAGLAALGTHAGGQSPSPTPGPAVPADILAKLKAANPDDPMAKFPPFETVVKGAKVYEGLFTLHQKDDHLYAELQPQHFNQSFLLPISVVKGAGMGGDTLNFGEEWVIQFRKVGDRVFLVRKNTRNRAAAGSPLAKAVDTAYSDSVLMAIPVKTQNPMKGSVVIDLNQIFFGDFAQLGIGFPDQSRTTWGKVKAFPGNVELQVAATYSGGRFFYYGGGTDVIDGRGINVTVQYGLVQMPDPGYQPRYADNRVGHFLSAVKDFSKEGPDTNYVRMVNRWRLERADGGSYKEGGKLSPPKKRIKFWIEDSVPDEYRTAVREGILEWNKAFEKIGFKDAIEVRQQDGEQFDPEDSSYATFRWTTRDYGGAIGPSRANPLTGEIYDADILFDGGFIRYYRDEARLFRDDSGKAIAEPASPIRAYQKGWDLPMHPLAFRNSPFAWNDRAAQPVPAEAREWQRRQAAAHGYCQCAGHKKNELTLAVLSLAAAAPGAKEGGEKAMDELIQQAVKEITMHEVGHTLGLRHNFKASTMLPADKLNDTTITRKQGLVGSVMDYSPANIAPPGTPQGDYFTTTLGPYDYWAIEYAYKPGATDEELKKIASRVADPKLIYGTDEDMYGSPDPHINVWDLGSEPLQYAKDRVKLAQHLFGKIEDKVVENGDGYARLRQAFAVLMGQYGDAAYLSSRYVGGINVHRDRKGDPNGRDPLVPVPAAKQREALAFVKENVLTDKPFQFSPELLRKLTREKWYHTGSEGLSYGGAEYPLNQMVLSIQETVLDEVLDGGTLTRIQNAARTAPKADKPLTVDEVFRCLTDAIFADLPTNGSKPGGESSVLTRNLQRAYVARLAGMVLGPKSNSGGYSFVIFIGGGGGGSAPADAKSLARLHLKEIQARVESGLKAAKDDTAKAFLDETKDRIAKVLDAKVSANEP